MSQSEFKLSDNVIEIAEGLVSNLSSGTFNQIVNILNVNPGESPDESAVNKLAAVIQVLANTYKHDDETDKLGSPQPPIEIIEIAPDSDLNFDTSPIGEEIIGSASIKINVIQVSPPNPPMGATLIQRMILYKKLVIENLGDNPIGPITLYRRESIYPGHHMMWDKPVGEILRIAERSSETWCEGPSFTHCYCVAPFEYKYDVFRYQAC